MNCFVVIVTYNGMKWIEKCLESISSNFSIILIDNASEDDTVNFVSNSFPEIDIIASKKNLGFGQANNIGIKKAMQKNADYVFLLNQDAYVVDDAIMRLIEIHRQNKNYGILSPIHINAQKNKLDFNFSKYVSPQFNSDFFSDHVMGVRLLDIYEMPFVNAAAWLLSKECIEKVGGFDPLFFHYGEDNNYCQRVLFHEFKIGVVPNTYIIHDRENRKEKEIIEGSEDYFNNIVKYYKVLSTDINDKDAIKILNNRLMRLIAYFFGSVLLLRFKKTKNISKEFFLLRKLKPEVKKSRNLNVKVGSVYL